MFCTACGKELPDEAHFCVGCGNACTTLPAAAAVPPQLLPSAELTLRQIFASFTQRERNILLAIVIIPIMFMFTGNFSRLLWGNFRLMNTFNVALSIVGVLFFVAILIVCGTTKKWNLLWPLLLFAGLPFVNSVTGFLSNYLMAALSLNFYFDDPSINVIFFITDIIAMLVATARHASIWLTVYLVGRYFMRKQNFKPEENFL